ncbi:olfactory receptor 8J2-like [Desmodus rotundus]|uniref:olfactory receptor 8J2-like n=1 Tax=Desmodus rotundus TaxID=9430 RepID=UPI002381756E|nr:olfactory receptor 8J2-like [Desmodus rotundus]
MAYAYRNKEQPCVALPSVILQKRKYIAARKSMAPGNLSQVTEFILMGISDRPELQIPLFFVFLVIYGLTVAGNLGIITLTSVDSQLQTPMYFFLRQLAVVNLGNSTVIAPKMLVNFLVSKKTISYYGCAVQLGGFVLFIVAEIFTLAAMAYDRYVAVCDPLHYMVVVSPQICLLLVSLIHFYSLTIALTVSSSVFSVSYCSSNVINHFYCDNVPLLALSCSDTYVPETAAFSFSGINLIFSMIIVLISYFNIILAILRIRSSEGRHKAFSTCASHLMAVTVFYGTLLFMYLQPRTNHSLHTDKTASVFYTLVIPMLNPLIYSLRNKDVKDALKRFLHNPFQSLKLT